VICLGIESTAHTSGVGIAHYQDETEILANVNSSYSPPSGGIHPREAAEHHVKAIPALIEKAMDRAGLGFKELDLIAFAKGPGLGPCLRVGATAARALSLTLKKPIVGVNHCIAHMEIGKQQTGCKNPVMLYVSGGNTQVIGYRQKRYRIVGETLDIGIGNLLDKFGRKFSLQFPCGPKIEELARSGKKMVELPYSVKGMDVSFSGILTSLSNLKGEKLEDLCFSLQETAFAMLVEVTERAMAYLENDELLLGGGVASNNRLREMCSIMAEERGAELFVPERQYCVDNGGMIALLGLLMKDQSTFDLDRTKVDQNFRTDEVEVAWL
jgi:universal protein Kae1